MEDFRSKSCKMDTFNGRGGGNMYNKAPTSMQDLRCYSATTYQMNDNNNSYEVGDHQKEIKMKKSKSRNLGKSTSSKNWSFNDPEMQRKTRVASYKVYAVEGKMKGSLRKSFKWIKNTYTQMIHGW